MESRAFFTETVGERDTGVSEEQFGSVLGVHPDLVEVAAALEPRRVALDDQQGHAPMTLRRVRLHGGDHQVGVDPVGDERLRAVDEVVVAVTDGGGRHRRQIGTDARLRHRHGGDQLAGADAREPSLLLFVVGMVDEVRQAYVVVQGDAETGGVDVGALQLLGDHDVEPEVGDPATSVPLGNIHAEEPTGARRREQGAIHNP